MKTNKHELNFKQKQKHKQPQPEKSEVVTTNQSQENQQTNTNANSTNMNAKRKQTQTNNTFETSNSILQHEEFPEWLIHLIKTCQLMQPFLTCLCAR